jgi:cyclopropane-fatty-acyl-phospholipid synthase
MEQGALLGRIEDKLRELRLPIAITLWDGRRLEAGGGVDVNVTIRSPKVLASLMTPTMGKLARHYVEHELDLEGEPRQIIRLGEALAESPGVAAATTARLRKWIGHTRVFDRKAIRHHYDVSDEFFGLWLDARRVYSCAYFRRADDTLEMASRSRRTSTNTPAQRYGKPVSMARAKCA